MAASEMDEVMSYTFTLPGTQGPVTIIVHRDGQLEMLDYDADYELSMVEFGEKEADLSKIYRYWPGDPTHCILKLFEVPFIDLLRLCVDLVDNSLRHISGHDHIWYEAVGWINLMRDSIDAIEKRGAYADVSVLENSEPKIRNSIYGLKVQDQPAGSPVNDRYTIMRSIKHLTGCVKSVRSLIILDASATTLGKAIKAGGTADTVADLIISKLMNDVVYDVIDMGGIEGVVSIENPVVAWLVNHFVDYMNSKQLKETEAR